jgi:hypothetical protein
VSNYIFETSMRFRVDKKDPAGRIFMSVFCGTNPATRPKVGDLVLLESEYQAFFASLRLGAHAMMQVAKEGIYVPLEVTVTGECEALGSDIIPDEVHFPTPRPPWVE